MSFFILITPYVIITFYVEIKSKKYYNKIKKKGRDLVKFYKKLSAMVLSAVIGLSSFSFLTFAQEKDTMSFNFTSQYVENSQRVYGNLGIAPKYTDSKGFGFVSETSSMPSRSVNISKIKPTSEGYTIVETDASKFNFTNEDGESVTLSKSTTHNLGGMVFRVKAAPGGYNVKVEVEGGKENAIVSISAMQATRVNTTEYWDAAKLVPNLHIGKWEGDIYSLDYANGRDFIDIEIEPAAIGKKIVLKSIEITPVENNKAEKPTVYLLGDSTLKSYTFEEAPMCGWGQVFDRLFDSKKINVVNYSMGGRSLKQMYQEGRLNDVLMTGAEGDFVIIQSGHNDEKKGADSDPTARFGVGSTEAMFKSYIEDIYIPAIEARGMIPILVTPMTRVSELKAGEVYKDSFTTEDREFPKVMRVAAEETDTPLVDLNAKSVEYLNSIGQKTVQAMVMSLEAGETPAKTNSGSYANGHPQNKIDGTHMKEALAKQYARIVAEEIKSLSSEYTYLSTMVNAMTEDVQSGNWNKVYPEIANDVTGDNGYYRNQIEKMIQLGVMTKDKEGNFNPKADITVSEYVTAINSLYGCNIKNDSTEPLTREAMAIINLEAYDFKYSEKPKYMTDYNGSNIAPDDPNYDPNLVGDEAQYYPLVGFDAVEDIKDITNTNLSTVKRAYNLGLIRCDEDVERGKMENSTSLLPQKVVTREKAAKSLYFMYVLGNDINTENDVIK